MSALPWIAVVVVVALIAWLLLRGKKEPVRPAPRPVPPLPIPEPEPIPEPVEPEPEEPEPEEPEEPEPEEPEPEPEPTPEPVPEPVPEPEPTPTPKPAGTPCMDGDGPLIRVVAFAPYDNRKLPAGARLDLSGLDVTEVGEKNAMLRLFGAHGGCMSGGRISADDMPPESTLWDDWHKRGNGLRLEETRNFRAFGLYMGNVGDGIKVIRNCPNVIINGIRIRWAGDDAFELDYYRAGAGSSGNVVIRHALVDSCWVAISARCPAADAEIADGRGKLIDVADSLIAVLPRPHVYKPERYPAPGNSSPFKWDTRGTGRGVPLRLRRFVLVMKQPGYFDLDRQRTAGRKAMIDLSASGYLTPDSSDNLFVWLGAGDAPVEKHPAWTVTRDRDAVKAWKADFEKHYPTLK